AFTPIREHNSSRSATRNRQRPRPIKTTGSMGPRFVKCFGIEAGGRHDARNTDGPRAILPGCPTVGIPARSGDEKDALLGTAATVGHNHLQCLAFAYRKYQRTHSTIISSAKCRPRNSAGRSWRIE